MKWLAIMAAGLAASLASVPAPSWAQLTPPALPQATAPTYYYNDSGKPAGPFTLEEIQQKVAAGLVTPDTLVWAPGMPGWVAFKEAMGQPSPQPLPVLGGEGCNGKHVILADDFTDPQSWTGDTTTESGKLKFKTNPGQWAWSIWRRPIPGDASICMTVQMPHRFEDATQTVAGLVIASQDSNNFYAFVISPTGNAALLRHKGSDFTEPTIQFRAVGDIKSDAGAKNDLRVNISGGTYTMFVNGAKFDSFTPETPSGHRVGILVLSEKARANAWKFARFKVTDTE